MTAKTIQLEFHTHPAALRQFTTVAEQREYISYEFKRCKEQYREYASTIDQAEREAAATALAKARLRAHEAWKALRSEQVATGPRATA
jgi:hypothetical protein